MEIVPTIGRKLWLFIDNQMPRRERYVGATCHDERQAFDASVCYVHPDKKGTEFHFITVTFADHNGVPWTAEVPLRQEGQARPLAREWAEWMPHQVDQAKTAATQVEAVFTALQEPKPAAAAPPRRLTLENIEDTIVADQFYAVPGTTVTHCTLTLRNGAKVVGHNYGAIDPAQQDWELGRKEARAMAVEKVWELEGYLRIQRLWECDGFAPA